MRMSVDLVAALALIGGSALIGSAEAQRAGPDPADVFISEDTDDFDPGLAIGEQFPAIRALYRGQEITDIDAFIRDKGAVFIANRSVDW
jgi:hypothetical protein